MRFEFPDIGDKRILFRFLLFPVIIEGETRWLEFAYIRQIYKSNVYTSGWVNAFFVEKKDLPVDLKVITWQRYLLYVVLCYILAEIARNLGLF